MIHNKSFHYRLVGDEVGTSILGNTKHYQDGKLQIPNTRKAFVCLGWSPRVLLANYSACGTAHLVTRNLSNLVLGTMRKPAFEPRQYILFPGTPQKPLRSAVWNHQSVSVPGNFLAIFLRIFRNDPRSTLQKLFLMSCGGEIAPRPSRRGLLLFIFQAWDVDRTQSPSTPEANDWLNGLCGSCWWQEVRWGSWAMSQRHLRIPSQRKALKSQSFGEMKQGQKLEHDGNVPSWTIKIHAWPTFSRINSCKKTC